MTKKQLIDSMSEMSDDCQLVLSIIFKTGSIECYAESAEWDENEITITGFIK